MDKVFDVEIDGQVTLPDGSTLGPLEETTVNVVQPSEGISDPIVENAKETGGFGWTEQSEQTVITWDGNTEGRDVLTIIDSEHPDDVIRMYKVTEYSSKQFTENCEFFVAGSQLRDVTLYTYDHAEMYGVVYPLAIRTDGTDFDIQHVGTVHAESSGVYFIDLDGAYVESLTYGTPDTVHKIDPKYLGGGGMLVVHGVLGEDGLALDKTYSEIFSAIPNVCILTNEYQMHTYRDATDEDGVMFSYIFPFISESEEVSGIMAEVISVKSDNTVTVKYGEKEF